jgi:hypothetical protein
MGMQAMTYHGNEPVDWGEKLITFLETGSSDASNTVEINEESWAVIKGHPMTRSTATPDANCPKGGNMVLSDNDMPSSSSFVASVFFTSILITAVAGL